jgi:hypothetical protein
MKTLFKFVVVAVIMFMATTAIAQEWTKAQKEVWKVVQDSWTDYKAGNIEASVACVHEKYQGWDAHSPLPMTKEMILQWYTQMQELGQMTNFSLNPARIVVTDDAAVVDYFYDYTISHTQGDGKKIESVSGRSVEFYVKEGGKWLLLGDMGVRDDKVDEDD